MCGSARCAAIGLVYRTVGDAAAHHLGDLAAVDVDQPYPAALRGGHDAEPLAAVVQPRPLPDVGAVGRITVGHVRHLAGGRVHQPAGVVGEILESPPLGGGAGAGALRDVGAVGGGAAGDLHALAAVAVDDRVGGRGGGG